MLRALTCATLLVLGIGYLFAMLHLFNSHAGRDGEPGISVKDIEIAYSGSKDDTRLEAALKGPMSGMLPADERATISDWVRRGTDETEYESRIRPILAERCIACHDGSNPHIADLSEYRGVLRYAEMDTGADIFTLVRVSHIHLFGLTFIFFIMGFIFSHAYVRPLWLKSVVIAVPFLAIFVDVGSWYVTKLYPPFAWVVLISGGFMGLSFAFMWLISAYQMWLYKAAGRAAGHEEAPIH